MKRIGIGSIVAAAVGLTATTVLAAEPTIGPPLDAAGDARMVPDTYQLAELRAADPEGGPPWGSPPSSSSRRQSFATRSESCAPSWGAS